MRETERWGTMPERLAAAGGDAGAAAETLLGALSETETARLTSGSRHLHQEIGAAVTGRYNFVPYPAAGVPRLGVPGVRFSDGPRGAVVGHATAFPCAMGRGASFDPALEARVGDAIGRELTAQGANFFGGVCVNLLRHPGWGRAQESFGEDSLLLGAMGAALTRGAGAHAATCVKHYACNSIENARFKVDVRIEEADLRDIYLPHFRRCIEAGADCVMSAYNKVNGEWCGHHRHLLTEILREEWGFAGFVMSDFLLGVRDMPAALEAGLDLEMPMRWRGLAVPRALREGRLAGDTVRRAAFRILRAMFAACGRAGGAPAPHEAVAGAEHRALAREAARRSMVLLKNAPVAGRPVLPLETGPGRSIALIGRLAGLENTGDLGSSKVRARGVVTPAAGMAAAAAQHGAALRTSLSDRLDAARAAARGADAAVVVVGNTWREEGEYVFAYGGDRTRLELLPQHEALIEAVAAVCPRTVAVLIGGSAIVCEAWQARVPALLMGWYAGSEGGHALAEVLFGAHAPAGRLPFTVPRSAGQLPPFDPRAREAVYGPLHGYRLFHARGAAPAFWFGHGLGYAPIEWGAPEFHDDSAGAYLAVPLRNAGTMPQRETVQAYLDAALGTHPAHLPALAGFANAELAPGESRVLRVPIDEALRRRAARGAVPRAARSAAG